MNAQRESGAWRLVPWFSNSQTLSWVNFCTHEAYFEAICDDARVRSFCRVSFHPECMFGEVDGAMRFEPGRAKATGSQS